MGNLLKLFRGNHDNNEIKGNIFLDFENAQPTEEEAEAYNKITSVIDDLETVLSALKIYPGSEYYIKRIFDDPTDEDAWNETWNNIKPLVMNLKKLYKLASSLEECLLPVLEVLCKGENSIKNFERLQALSRVFARLLNFTMDFDALKVKKPSIQNDFSYYRRVTSKGVKKDSLIQIVDDVQGELVNSILLFLASPTPFMSKISEIVTHHFRKEGHPNLVSVTESFSTLASLCKMMVETPFKMKETKLFCLRVMVALIILCDHVHPNGIFCKGSQIDIKSFARLLKEQDEESKVALISSIRFSSKHFNDDTTPQGIKTLLEDS